MKPGWWTIALACVLAFGGGGRMKADEAAALEYQVKAAFLLKFALFVEWPAATHSGSDEPFKIGILGKDPFGKNFDDAVKSERIRGHSVQLCRAEKPSQLEGCRVIFISVSESKRCEELLRGMEGKPVLTTGDEPDFARRGGMIGFVKEKGKVRFEINVAAAERAGLRLSAKLLQVGIIVVPGKSGVEG